MQRSRNRHRHLPLPAVLLALLVAVVPAAEPAAAQAPPVKMPASDPGLESDIALLERLDKSARSRFTFEDATVDEVLEAIDKASGLSVSMDRNAMGDSGGWRLRRLSCDVATPREAFDAVASAISDVVSEMRIEVAAGLLVLTDQSGAARLAATAYYDSEPFTGLVAGADDDERCRRTVEYLAAHIAPGQWAQDGGETVSAVCLGRQLAVNAPPSVHLAIRRALQSARELAPPMNLVWSMRIYSWRGEEEGAPTVEAIARDPAGVGDTHLKAAPTILASRDEAAGLMMTGDGLELAVDLTPLGSGRFLAALRLEESGRRTTVTLSVSPGERRLAATTSDGRTTVLEITGEAADARR